MRNWRLEEPPRYFPRVDDDGGDDDDDDGDVDDLDHKVGIDDDEYDDDDDLLLRNWSPEEPPRYFPGNQTGCRLLKVDELSHTFEGRCPKKEC